VGLVLDHPIHPSEIRRHGTPIDWWDFLS